MMETYEITGVEVFSVGKWNQSSITQKHLEDMVAAFEETKKKWPPQLKIGHNDKQPLKDDPEIKEQMENGYPAFGWAKRLYIKGSKLVADFEYVPKKLFNLIQSRAYRKVSCEVYWDVSVDGKVYSALLGAVALLGAEKQAVQNLDDILAHYQKTGNGTLSIYTETADLQFNEMGDEPNRKDKPMSKTENEIKLETQLATQNEAMNELKKQFSAFQTESATKDKTIADLQKKVEEAGKKEAELQAANAKTARAAFATELVTSKAATPAMKPLIEQLLEDGRSNFSIGEKNDATKQDALKELLSLAKKSFSVNLEEGSEAANAAAKDKKSKEDKLDAKAKEIAAKEKISYSAALKQAMAEGEEQPQTQE